MTENTKFAAVAVAGTIVAISAVKSITRIRNKKREIQDEAVRQIDAINIAKLRMFDRIDRGEYGPGDVDNMLSDFKFEIIAERFDG